MTMANDLPLTQETIDAVALKFGDTIHTLPRPSRHGDVIRAMYEGGISRAVIAEATQGFITSYVRFVDRWVAHRIAHAAGQTAKLPTLHSELFSEDVW